MRAEQNRGARRAAARLAFALATLAFARLSGTCAPALADESEPPPLQFGVFPFLAAVRLEAIFSPLAAAVGEELGRPVALRSAADFGEFREKLRDGEFDLAFVQPFDYVRAGAPAGYRPLARAAENLLAVLVSRNPRPETSLSELSDTRIGVPPPDAAITLLTRITLEEAGHDPAGGVQLVHFSTHDSCLQQLLIGELDLCATAPLPLRLFEKRMDVELHRVAVSQEIPASLFVAHPRLPPEERAAIRRKLLAPEFVELVPFFEAGLVKASDADYAPLRGREWRRLSAGPAFGPVLPFGIVPTLPIDRIEAVYAPAASLVSQHLGVPVQLRTSRSHERFLANLRRGDYALAIVDPFDYLEVSDHYQPVVRSETPLAGAVFMRLGETVGSWEELRGRSIGVPQGGSTVARLTRCALLEAGLEPDRDVFLSPVGNCADCLEMLASGRVDACVLNPVALQLIALPGPAGFAEALRTRAVPGALVVAHENLPEPMTATLRNLILSWEDFSDRARPEPLASAGVPRAASREEYEALRATDGSGCPPIPGEAEGAAP